MRAEGDWYHILNLEGDNEIKQCDSVILRGFVYTWSSFTVGVLASVRINVSIEFIIPHRYKCSWSCQY